MFFKKLLIARSEFNKKMTLNLYGFVIFSFVNQLRPNFCKNLLFLGSGCFSDVYKVCMLKFRINLCLMTPATTIFWAKLYLTEQPKRSTQTQASCIYNACFVTAQCHPKSLYYFQSHPILQDFFHAYMCYQRKKYYFLAYFMQIFAFAQTRHCLMNNILT